MPYLETPPSPYATKILRKYAGNDGGEPPAANIIEETMSGGQVVAVKIKSHLDLYEPFTRLGWRFRELLLSSLLEADRERYLGVEVHLDLHPTNGSVAALGLAGAWARDEDAIVVFDATMMAASERKSVPHLLKVELQPLF